MFWFGMAYEQSINLLGVTPLQQQILKEALDLYMRLGLEQLNSVVDLVERHRGMIGGTDSSSEDVDRLTRELSIVMFGHSTNCGPGIGGAVSATTREAHDLLDHLRSHGSFGSSPVRFGMEPLPEIQSAGSPDDQL